MLPSRVATPPPLVEGMLDWNVCTDLGGRMAEMDAKECLSMGLTPVQALASGTMLGWSRAVFRRHTGLSVGAFGCTPQGTIWSLWAPLGMREQKQVLRETRKWVQRMLQTDCAKAYGKPLHNFMDASNGRALHWLEATECFVVDDRPFKHATAGYVFYFETKPYKDLLHV